MKIPKFKKTAKSTDPSDPEISKQSVHPVLKKVLLVTLLITAMVFLSIMIYFNGNSSIVITTIISVIAVYFSGGLILGFIFAIPKKLQNPQTGSQQTDAENKDGEYKDNTSLEEISDWITKIIIGLSLTQFTYIKGLIGEAALNIAKSIASAWPCVQPGCTTIFDFYPFCYAIVIFYAISGAIIGYLWTRIEFPKILTQKDKDLKDIASQLLQAKSDLKISKNNQKLEFEKKLTAVRIKIESFLYQKNLVQQYESSAEDKIKKYIQQVQPDEVTVYDDCQKNRWGGNKKVSSFVLEANIIKAENANRIFNVELYIQQIQSEYNEESSLLKEAYFFMHHTYDELIMRANIDDQNQRRASISVLSYEAATVGAIVVDGNDNLYKLELDLNSYERTPESYQYKETLPTYTQLLAEEKQILASLINLAE